MQDHLRKKSIKKVNQENKKIKEEKKVMQEENVISKKNIEYNHFYSIRLKKRQERRWGFIGKDGADWLLIKSLFSDYIMDGWEIINKRYIQSISRSKREIFTEEVLKANEKMIQNEGIDVPLSDELLFEWLFENQIVFQISVNDERITYIGKISRLLEKSFYMVPLSTNATWLNEKYLFRKTAIRIISLDTDYINSLLKYNKSLKNQ